jgi:hypothetical protein
MGFDIGYFSLFSLLNVDVMTDLLGNGISGVVNIRFTSTPFSKEIMDVSDVS